MDRTQTARAAIFNAMGELLMIDRFKQGKHYFVLPCGRVEENETAERAVIREVLEETGLSVRVDRLLYVDNDALGHRESIFLCTLLGGNNVLSLQSDSIEARQMRKGEQSWKPDWFSMASLNGETVYPVSLLNALMSDKAKAFTENPREINEPGVGGH